MTSVLMASLERAEAPDPLLEVDDLGVSFDTPSGSLRAVDGVSVRIHRGETLGIVGESGSGKSVLSRAIMNLLSRNAQVDESSQIRFDGRDVRALSRREMRHYWGGEVAMVFQDPMTSLTPVLTVGRQLSEPLRFHLGLGRKQARERALELLAHVGIPEAERRYDAYPHKLSGGMRQRVMIAIALSCGPKLLIADEPTTALDVTIQQQILNLLAGVQREREMAMILVTHDLGVVAARADRIAVMYAGRIVELAPTRTLFDRARHPYTQALLRSIPRLSEPSHTRLHTIPGRPPAPSEVVAGCPFAPRCDRAQPRCLVERPGLEADGDPGHEFACFFPVGTPEGDAVLAANRDAGHTASGRPLAVEAAD
jgi:peptide/nickel transport system ATP-binding protein